MSYVASSWRNAWQEYVVGYLRGLGFSVYDFRHPKPGDDGFSWGNIAEEWEGWSLEDYLEGLDHPIAREGYMSDISALQDSDACLLVLPCGRSAHLEAGFAAGTGKITCAFVPEDIEPELMYLMFDFVSGNLPEIGDFLLSMLDPD